MRKPAMLLAVAAVALLCVATSPAQAEYEFSLFGSPYWAPDETDEVAGGGLSFDIPITLELAGGSARVVLRGDQPRRVRRSARDRRRRTARSARTGSRCCRSRSAAATTSCPSARFVRMPAPASATTCSTPSSATSTTRVATTVWSASASATRRRPTSSSRPTTAAWKPPSRWIPTRSSDFEGFDEDVGIDLDGLGFNIGVSFRFGG